MSMVINQSMDAMNTSRLFMYTTDSQAQSTDKLSGESEINATADNAAELSISTDIEQMMHAGYDNAKNDDEYKKAVDEALESVQSMLQRISELAIKASSSTISTIDRYLINEEMKEIRYEIQEINKDAEEDEKDTYDCDTSVIDDVDFKSSEDGTSVVISDEATKMINSFSDSVLTDVSQSMLTQANQSNQETYSLLSK